MALVLGTNSGFVTIRPTADPAGSNTTIDGSSVVTKHTSPVGAVKITEIGWYRGAGTNTANFEIALYAESAGVAAARLFVDNTNSSNVQGWITVTVDWAVSPSTAYWLAVQMDAHSGSSSIDSATPGGAGSDVLTSQTALNDPYGGGAVADANGMYAIYALTQRALERAVLVDGAGLITTSAIFFTIFERATATDAVGAVTVSGQFFTVFERATATDAVGAVTVSGEFFTVFERAATLDATGAIATSGEVESGSATFERAAAIDAAGSIATGRQVDHLRAVAVNATGAVEADGHGILERQVAVDGVGAITTAATFFSVIERAVATDGVATITTARQVEFQRSVAVDGIGSIATSGFVPGAEFERSATLDAVGAIASSGVFFSIIERTAAVSATATTTVTAQRDLQRAAQISATATVTVTAQREVNRSVSLSAVAAIIVTFTNEVVLVPAFTAVVPEDPRPIAIVGAQVPYVVGEVDHIAIA